MIVTLKTVPFDAAEFLDSSEAIAAFLEDAFASGDAAEISSALGAVARAHGMTQLAAETGLNRQALYRAFSPDGNASLETLLKVTQALGLQLTPVPAKPAA